MSGFLLDTNVVSELTKDAPNPRVVAFLTEQDDLWLSALVLHELEFGLQLLPSGQRRDGLRSVLSEFIAAYEDRILPLERTGQSGLPNSGRRRIALVACWTWGMR